MVIEKVTVINENGERIEGYFLDNESNLAEHRKHEFWEMAAITIGIITGVLTAAHMLKKGE